MAFTTIFDNWLASSYYLFLGYHSIKRLSSSWQSICGANQPKLSQDYCLKRLFPAVLGHDIIFVSLMFLSELPSLIDDVMLVTVKRQLLHILLFLTYFLTWVRIFALAPVTGLPHKLLRGFTGQD